MEESKKNYKAISDEVRQLAEEVEGVALSGAQVFSGGKKRRKSSKKSAGGATKRKSSRKGSKKRKGSKRRGSKKGMAAFGSQLINLGLRMQNMQIDGGKKKGKVAQRSVMGTLI